MTTKAKSNVGPYKINETACYAFASGHIRFGVPIPTGALMIARGDSAVLREFIAGLARHSRTNDDLFVPGVPEAEGEIAAFNAFMDWKEKIRHLGERKGIKVL